jgi:predicted lipoprotein with Yx(FWY)xxD motif
MRRSLLPLLATAALIVAGCGSDYGDDDAAPEAADTATDQKSKPSKQPKAEAAPKVKGTAIKLASSQYGQVLFDRAGQAIYLFDKEKSARAQCYDECAAAWPPVLTRGEPQAGTGIDASLLGTTKRDDGKTQVTYNEHPLYYYAHEGRNEVRCHNVNEFGGLWLAMNGEGNALD